MYIGANVFTIGDSGWNILMQIYIAETTSVVSRGLWNVLPEGIGEVLHSPARLLLILTRLSTMLQVPLPPCIQAVRWAA